MPKSVRIGTFGPFTADPFCGHLGYVLDDLRARYTLAELDSDFYRSAFKEAIGSRSFAEMSESVRQRVEMLLHDLLAAWDALFSAKVLNTQLGSLAESKKQFMVRITDRVNEHRRIQALFTPFVDYQIGLGFVQRVRRGRSGHSRRICQFVGGKTTCGIWLDYRSIA